MSPTRLCCRVLDRAPDSPTILIPRGCAVLRALIVGWNVGRIDLLDVSDLIHDTIGREFGLDLRGPRGCWSVEDRSGRASGDVTADPFGV